MKIKIYTDKANAKNTTANVSAITLFNIAPFGAGAGAYPSDGGNATDSALGEGGALIISDDGETGDGIVTLTELSGAVAGD